MGKNDVLKEIGSYNPKHEDVTAPHFQKREFF